MSMKYHYFGNMCTHVHIYTHTHTRIYGHTFDEHLSYLVSCEGGVLYYMKRGGAALN